MDVEHKKVTYILVRVEEPDEVGHRTHAGEIRRAIHALSSSKNMAVGDMLFKSGRDTDYYGLPSLFPELDALYVARMARILDIQHRRHPKDIPQNPTTLDD
jgi:hypothetical protein